MVVGALQGLEVGDARQDQQRPAAAVLSEKNVRVQTVAHHADLGLVDAVAAKENRDVSAPDCKLPLSIGQVDAGVVFTLLTTSMLVLRTV